MLSPVALLCLLCCCTLLLFGDRGVVSCNSVNGDSTFGIQKDFNLTLSQDGWVYAALMVGLSLSAPLAAQLSKHWNALRLIGCGVALAAVGAAGSGLAPTFSLLLLSRALIGIGCGPFIALASPLIDDCAPPQRKSVFLAVLFLCIPVGFALGYIWGSQVATAWGWRAAFLVEAALMAPLASICLLLQQPVDVQRSKHATASAMHHFDGPGRRQALLPVAAFLRDLGQLATRPVVVLTMLAAASFNAALGGFSFYGPKAARAIFALDPPSADALFGLVTVVTGVLGTLSGGLLLDGMGPSVRTALLLCTLGLGVGATAILAAFGASNNLLQFCAGFALGEGAMFMTAAPANAVLLWSVPAELRPAALSISEVLTHALGDVPVPPLLGLLQQRAGNWRLTMCVCSGFLGLAALLFCCALWAARVSVGAVEEVLALEGTDLMESSELEGADEVASGAEITQPLLQGDACA